MSFFEVFGKFKMAAIGKKTHVILSIFGLPHLKSLKNHLAMLYNDILHQSQLFLKLLKIQDGHHWQKTQFFNVILSIFGLPHLKSQWNDLAMVYNDILH